MENTNSDNKEPKESSSISKSGVTDSKNESDEVKSQPAPTITVTTDDLKSANPAISPSETTSDQQPTSKAVVTNVPKKISKGLIVALAVLVIAVIGVGAYLVLKSSKSTPQSSVVVKKDIADLEVDELGEGQPASFYPNIPDESNTVLLNMQIFEGLTKFEDGTTIVPDLAVSWTNPNTSTWIFKLRPNVKFHTGRTMTATDVKASIEAMQAPGSGQQAELGQEFAATIKSIEVINPLTVEIDTNGPDPLMLNELTRLWIFDTTSGKANNAINGTGPYNVASITPNDIKLTAFNNYWGGHIYTKEVDYLEYQAGSDIPSNLLTSKKLQVISVPIDPAFVAKLKSDGYVVSSSPSYTVGQLVFDTRSAGTPLASAAVRRALAEAVNKPALISVSGHAGSPPTNQIIAQGIPGYDPSIPTVPFSVAKAKAALAAAGYPNGFSFNFAYYSEAPNTALADEFQKEMAAIGVTVDLEPQTDIDAYGNIVQNGGADMYYDLVSSGYVDGSDILSFFVDSPYYSSPAMDALNTQASQTLDATKRVQLLQQMNALVTSDQADIPIFQEESQELAVAPHIVIMHDTDGVVSVNSYFYHDYQN